MNTTVEQPPAVELPPLTAEEVALIERATSSTAALATVREYLSFLTRRRRVVDALVKKVYPEWPTEGAIVRVEEDGDSR